MQHNRLGEEREVDSMSSKNRITVNLSDKEAAQLAALAERVNVSKAWIGRHAICTLLEQTSNDDLQILLPFLSATEVKER